MCDRVPLFMRNLKPLLFSLAIFGLAMNLPLSAVTGEGELKAENCSTADFFREADVKGTLSSDVSGFQRVKAFPVLMNAIYKPPRDGAVRHYSVVCRFNLAQGVKEDRYLYLPGIGENFAIYLNGEKIHDDMHVQNGRLIRYRYTKFMNLPLPSHLVRPGNNTLFFHIAGYAPLTPLSDNFLLGLPFRSGYAISTEREQGPGSLLLFFLTASYIFFGLYHFFFYLRWREKQYNLHFAVFSLAISAYFLAFSQEAFFRVSDTRYLIMVSYSCQMLALGFFLLYVQKFFFETYRVPLYIRIGVVADLVLAALVLAGRDTWQQSLLTFWYFTALPQILVVFYLIGRAVKQRLPDARTLALAIFMALLMIAFDMLDTLVFYSSVRLSQFAYFTVVVSLVLLMANRFISIHNETDRLNRQLSVERNSFSRFVPSQFLENLGKSTALEIRRGDTAQRQMGILFLDIRNFTGIAEKLTPAESLVFLNVFMRKMEHCISANGGFVDKYIGDGLLALFGSSDNNLMHGATQAVNAGRQMIESLKQLNRHTRAYGEIRIGIGVHCGSLVMGTLGSRHRLDTTVIGDAVNLASRLEMLTTLYGSTMLISGDVYDNLPAEMQSRTRKIDTVRVKGRKQPVTVYEDFSSEKERIIFFKEHSRAQYEQAFTLYQQGRFDEAKDLFDKIQEADLIDPVAAAMAKRSEKLGRNGAPLGWQGVLPLGKK